MNLHNDHRESMGEPFGSHLGQSWSLLRPLGLSWIRLGALLGRIVASLAPRRRLKRTKAFSPPSGGSCGALGTILGRFHDILGREVSNLKDAILFAL